jgi:5-dehydro-2-deoxygluconokinase
MLLPEVVSVGRVSVDLYAAEIAVGFDGQQSFTKSVGGSPTNVAVAAARLGRRAALVTKVGADGFGDYVRTRLEEWGVSTQYLAVLPGGQTPLALAALDPPESPQIAFYRGAAAPDTTLAEADLPEAVVRGCGLLWVSHAALAQGSTARAMTAWLEQRGRAAHTVLDLDFRPALWADVATARQAARTAIGLSTVVVGNVDECEMAVGSREPEVAADSLLSAGVDVAIVKLGADGVLLATPDGRLRVAPLPVDVLCGLGAGDAFGGALAHGLLSGWDIPRIGRFANAAGALVATRLTCADAMPSLAEIQALVVEGVGAT